MLRSSAEGKGGISLSEPRQLRGLRLGEGTGDKLGDDIAGGGDDAVVVVVAMATFIRSLEVTGTGGL